MDSETAVKLACIIAVAGMYFCRNKNTEETVRPRSTRRWWVRPIYMPEARESQGTHNNLIREMRLNDPGKYTKWMRMTPAMFDELLRVVGPQITKSYRARAPIDPCTKLELTIRYFFNTYNLTYIMLNFKMFMFFKGILLQAKALFRWLTNLD